MKFQWDPSKAASNISKHGVSFDEAMTVFVERQEDIVRIISARPATKQEIKDYEEFTRSQKQ
jgi:hypothetical protein